MTVRWRVVTYLVVWLAIAVLFWIVTFIPAHAEPDANTVRAAEAANVDPDDLAAAVSTVNAAGYAVDPWEFLYSSGELARPAPVIGTALSVTRDWPIGGALGQRLYCIEKIESNHGRAMWNPQPWHGEHAQGWLGWLPSTAARWGVIIGNRASEWNGAARMLARGAGSQFFGVAAGLC